MKQSSRRGGVPLRGSRRRAGRHAGTEGEGPFRPVRRGYNHARATKEGR